MAKKIPVSRITVLEYFQQQIVAVGQNGVVVLWNLALKEASKVSAAWFVHLVSAFFGIN